METEHSTYCRKEKEIATIFEKVKRIEKEVVGNGEGLVKTVPKLVTTVNDLKLVTSNLDRNLDKVVKAIDHNEGEKDGKAEIRRRTRWLVGILITIMSILLTGLIYTIHQLAQAGG
jgi:hypothetical protein